MDVMLRPWRPEDAPSIARHADDPQVAANLRDVFPCPYQLSDAEEFIRLCRAAEPEQAIFRAIVVDGQAVGSVALTRGTDVCRRSAELGYWLGRALWGRGIMTKAVEEMCRTIRRVRRETEISLCVSFGLLREEEYRALKEAGVERCHANLETSRRYFPQMCTTHTYEDKVTNIQRARAAGLEVCSGGILGMGESWEDRLDLAVSLAELEISSIPLNLLRPIPGTPYEGMEPISNEDVLRTVAFFRYINPTAWIRMAAGRGQFLDGGAELFRSGANAAITGDMLTTTGTSMAGDRAMLLGLGYQG